MKILEGNIGEYLLSLWVGRGFLNRTQKQNHNKKIYKLNFIKIKYSYLLKDTFFGEAALGLCCCTWASSSCSEQGLLFVVVHGLLTAVASLVADHRL